MPPGIAALRGTVDAGLVSAFGVFEEPLQPPSRYAPPMQITKIVSAPFRVAGKVVTGVVRGLTGRS